MPLADSATTAVLSRLQAGVWTLKSAVPTPVPHGFDVLEAEWIADFRNVSKTALEVAAMWPLGTRYGSADFWLRSGMPERKGGNVWSFKGHYEGRISSSKPVSARIMSAQRVIQVDDIGLHAGFGLYDGVPANVRECEPSVEIGYVLIGTAPPTHLVGLEGTPAVSPTVRTSTWGSATLFRLNWPHNFVLEGVDADQIDGSSPTANYVRESWKFYQIKDPV